MTNGLPTNPSATGMSAYHASTRRPTFRSLIWSSGLYCHCSPLPPSNGHSLFGSVFWPTSIGLISTEAIAIANATSTLSIRNTSGQILVENVSLTLIRSREEHFFVRGQNAQDQLRPHRDIDHIARSDLQDVAVL